ncbi:MAG: hypothetical protein ACFB51_13485 [Anaerolineae bacterium]
MKFTTAFREGAEDYDEAFTFELNGLTGRCGGGMGVEVDGHPVAFDVWLSEGDADPVVTFLLTDNALNNEDILTVLGGSGEVMRLSEGQIVRLRTDSLRLESTVDSIDYGSQMRSIAIRRTFLDALLRRPEPDLTLNPTDYITALRTTLRVSPA